MQQGRIAVPSVEAGGLDGQRSVILATVKSLLWWMWKLEKLKRSPRLPTRATFRADAWSL